MFCDEKIIKVYLQKFKYDYPGANCYFNYYSDIVFYTTDEYKIVLETENHMISMGLNGVFKCRKEDFGLEYINIEVLESDSYELPGDDEEFIGFQTELFTGERLITVNKSDDVFNIIFDDFTMKIMPYSYKKLNMASNDLLEFNRVAGCDRYIKRNCDCGSEAEIVYNPFKNYVVRCKKCHKSTVGFECVQAATESWNLMKP